MDQCMPRGTSLDFSQSDQVAFLEVAVSMLELPKSRFRRTGVEDVANCKQPSAVFRASLQTSIPL